MRLINADNAVKHIEEMTLENERSQSNFSANWIINFLEAFPETKVEPITRCKDCKNYKLFTEVYVGKAYCEEYGGFITENDYCSRGARAYKMPEIEEMKKAADKFFIGGDEE